MKEPESYSLDWAKAKTKKMLMSGFLEHESELDFRILTAAVGSCLIHQSRKHPTVKRIEIAG